MTNWDISQEYKVSLTFKNHYINNQVDTKERLKNFNIRL